MTMKAIDGEGLLIHIDADGDGSLGSPFRTKPYSPPVNKNFTYRADTVGDQSGSFDTNVDGSITPVAFKIKPSPGEIMLLTRLIVYVQDSGAFDSDVWGNGITMSDGIDLVAKRGGVEESLPQFKIKTSGDMSSLCFDYSHVTHGTGDEYGTWRYTFEKSGNPIQLIGDDGDEYSVIINDDLTGLTKQFFTFQGEYV